MIASQKAATQEGFSLEEALPMMPPVAIKIFQKYPALRGVMDRGDFENECILHFMTKGYLDRYNPQVTSKIYFMWTGAKHKAVDILRKKNRSPRLVAEAVTSEDGESLSLYDIVPDKNAEDPMSELIVREALSVLDSEGRFEAVNIEGEGEHSLSEYSVFLLTFKGWSRGELAKYFKVTSSTIANYLKRAETKLREYYDGHR